MKLAILTQPLHHNYGGLLQNYALQQVLKRHGHQVETIWLTVPKPKVTRFNVICSRCKRTILNCLFPDKVTPFRYFRTDKEIAAIHKNTNGFIRKYISRSDYPVLVNNLRDYVNDNCFDGYIVGSDQCWRPKYNQGPFLPIMFLDFAKDIKNIKRIAYAASFGSDEWEMSPVLTDICASFAQLFDCITVREDSGVSLCKKYLKVNARHVLDPTMLLAREDYIALIDANNEPKSAGTLFYYILDPNEAKNSLINQMAAINEQIPYTVMPNIRPETHAQDDIRSYIDSCVYPRVTSWLRAFLDAETIVVDSFHGVVFSILFNKPFWAIGNRERGYSRFTSILKQFGLQDRLIDEAEIEAFKSNMCKNGLSQKPIDWQRIDDILEQERNRCTKLLIDSL